MSVLRDAHRGEYLAQVIFAGAQDFYPDKADQFRALIGYAHYFGKFTGLGSYMLDYIPTLDCLEAGVCPYCGLDVTRKDVTPEQYNAASIREKMLMYTCPRHKEIG